MIGFSLYSANKTSLGLGSIFLIISFFSTTKSVIIADEAQDRSIKIGMGIRNPLITTSYSEYKKSRDIFSALFYNSISLYNILEVFQKHTQSQ